MKKPKQQHGVMDRPLLVPVECALRAQKEDEQPSVECHRALQCQRCNFCLAHCTCGPKQRAPQVTKRLRKGEVVEEQGVLCPQA